MVEMTKKIISRSTAYHASAANMCIYGFVHRLSY